MDGPAGASALRPDPAGWRTRLDAVTVARYRASGAWSGTTIGARLRALAARAPDRILFIDDTGSSTVEETLAAARRLATALRELGVMPGDVVSFQLPNWREAAFIEVACSLGGFVCNPIVPIYRHAEVRFILGDARPKVLFLPRRFRGFDYQAMAERLAPDHPNLRLVFVRGSECGLAAMSAGADKSDPFDSPDADHVKLLLYTSGTTSTPKGVLHTHDTIDAEIGNFVARLQLSADDVVLMASTVCHITGYLYGIQMPITLGGTAVLMESWDAAAAADLVDRHGVTFTIGATPFLQELTWFAAVEARPLKSLRLFPCGGAPVPPSAVTEADAAFAHCKAFRIFGSTEAPTITLGCLDPDQAGRRATTEGQVVGHELRLCRSDGSDAPAGEEGEIAVRGPEVCIGYRDPSGNEAFDDDGYFHTGDLGRLDDDGYLTITGRLKDVIIRGGENISAKEVEDVLHTHPSVLNVAVVAMPHPRLGETGCAVVVVRAGGRFDSLDMRELLASSGLAKQKWPEHLELLDELPTTPSGKVRKNVLRDLVRMRPLDF